MLKLMKTNPAQMPVRKHLTTLALGAVCMSLVACGPGDEKEGESASIDHATARQAITSNTTLVSSKLSKTIAFVENSNLFTTGLDAAFAAGDSTTACAGPIDPNTGEPDETYCETPEPEPETVEIDTNLDEETAELTNFLETYVFADANVESESGTEVTYLLKGSVVCAQDGEPADPDCVSGIDDAQIRVVVTSPQEGDVDVDLLVGPNKANPLSFEIHTDLVAAEVDFGGIKASADHLGSITGEEVELPGTMEGRVRAELEVQGDQQIRAALSVLTAINVADGDYSVQLAATSPALEVSVDGTAKTIETVSNLGALDIAAPVTTYEWDSETGTETESSYQMGLHLGGLTATTLFDAAAEIVSITGMGLGSTTTTMAVDGAEVLAIDLNKNDGRTLDVTVKQGANDTIELEVSPKLDLQMAMKFAAASAAFGEVEEWMKDDVLRVVLDGATKPKLAAGENGLEVLEGKLTLSLDNAGTSHTIDAGMCLLGVDDAPTVDDGTGTEPTPEPEPTNPLEELEVGTCGG